jgi:hypothetical protein
MIEVNLCYLCFYRNITDYVIVCVDTFPPNLGTEEINEFKKIVLMLLWHSFWKRGCTTCNAFLPMLFANLLVTDNHRHHVQTNDITITNHYRAVLSKFWNVSSVDVLPPLVVVKEMDT